MTRFEKLLFSRASGAALGALRGGAPYEAGRMRMKE